MAPSKDDEAPAPARTLELSPQETSLLIRACRKYRSSLPIYLRTAREEVSLLDGILGRLERDRPQ